MAVKQCLKIQYRLEVGWKFIQLKPQGHEQRTIQGQPESLVFWLYSAGGSISPRLRFVDATRQTFQGVGELVRGKGWQRVVIPMEGPRLGHWGGANDGVVHEPIRWDTLLLLDKPARNEICEGEVYVAFPTLIR